jgi:hypothetical protein
VSVPGLGEALAVFCFEEEAELYLRYGDGGLRPLAFDLDGLVALLLGRWSRFDLVTLDPMPQNDAGIMLRLACMGRDAFLDYLMTDGGPGRRMRAHGPHTTRKGGRRFGYTRPDPGLVGGSPARE